MISFDVKLVNGEPEFFAVVGEWRSERSYGGPEGRDKALVEAFALVHGILRARFETERRFEEAVRFATRQHWNEYWKELKEFWDQVRWDEVVGALHQLAQGSAIRVVRDAEGNPRYSHRTPDGSWNGAWFKTVAAAEEAVNNPRGPKLPGS